MDMESKSNTLIKLMEQLKRDKAIVENTIIAEQEKFVHITDSLIFNM